jgi:hypothetical protein
MMMTSSSSSPMLSMLLFHCYHPKMLVSAFTTPSIHFGGTTVASSIRMLHQSATTTTATTTTTRFLGPTNTRFNRPKHFVRIPSRSNSGSNSYTAIYETSSSLSSSALDELKEKIKAKGDEIRQLKAKDRNDNSNNKDDTLLASHIEELLALKAQLPAPETVAQHTEEKKKKEMKQPLQPINNNNNKQSKNKNNHESEKELTESEIKNVRLAKIDAMRTAKVEPFEYSFVVTTSSAQLMQEYESKLGPGQEDEISDVAVAGRIMTRRVFGKLAFFTLQDESGIIQLQFDKNRLGDDFQVCTQRRNVGILCVCCREKWMLNRIYGMCLSPPLFSNRALRIGQTVAILWESGVPYEELIRVS